MNGTRVPIFNDHQGDLEVERLHWFTISFDQRRIECDLLFQAFAIQMLPCPRVAGGGAGVPWQMSLKIKEKKGKGPEAPHSRGWKVSTPTTSWDGQDNRMFREWDDIYTRLACSYIFLPWKKCLARQGYMSSFPRLDRQYPICLCWKLSLKEKQTTTNTLTRTRQVIHLQFSNADLMIHRIELSKLRPFLGIHETITEIKIHKQL